jgi:hypothetical protein
MSLRALSTPAAADIYGGGGNPYFGNVVGGSNPGEASTTATL